MRIRRHFSCQASGEHALSVIKNVSLYPAFLPFIRSAEIQSEQTKADASYAILVVGLGMEYEFIGSVKDASNNQLELGQVKGPFKSFKGIWRAQSVDTDACEVSIDCEFELKSLAHSLLLKSAQRRISSQLQTKFLNRIESTYQMTKE